MESTVQLEFDEEAGELNGIENKPGEVNRDLVTAKALGQCRVTGRLTKVHDGIFSAKPATLMIFEFEFHHELGQRLYRYQNGSITITFSSIEEDTYRNPVILNFFPVAVVGDPSSAEHESSWEVPVTLGVPTPFQAIVNPKFTHKSTYQRVERMRIQGSKYRSHRRLRDNNVVRWDIEENKLQKDGIPREFVCGVIVSNDYGEFTADVVIKVSTPIILRNYLIAKPWSKDAPIVFKKGAVNERVDALKELEGLDLSTLTEEQCLKLAPLPKEYPVMTRGQCVH
jgi:hypothetical protein